MHFLILIIASDAQKIRHSKSIFKHYQSTSIFLKQDFEISFPSCLELFYNFFNRLTLQKLSFFKHQNKNIVLLAYPLYLLFLPNKSFAKSSTGLVCSPTVSKKAFARSKIWFSIGGSSCCCGGCSGCGGCSIGGFSTVGSASVVEDVVNSVKKFIDTNSLLKYC